MNIESGLQVGCWRGFKNSMCLILAAEHPTCYQTMNISVYTVHLVVLYKPGETNTALKRLCSVNTTLIHR
jgi:hypothetical protein